VCSLRFTDTGLVSAFHDGRIELSEAPNQANAGREVPLTQQAFTSYQVNDHGTVSLGLVPSVVPDKIVLYSSEGTVTNCLRDLLKQLEKNTPRPVCSLNAEALTPLGLRKEDLIIECCGADISQEIQFKTAVATALAAVSQSGTTQFVDFVISREQERVPVHIMTQPCRPLSLETSLTPHHAAAILGLIMECQNGPAAMAQRENNFRPTRGGFENGQKAPNRYFDVYLPDDAGLEELLEAQLSPLDIIVAIDGHLLKNKNEDADWLKGLIAQVAAEQKQQYTVDVKRGEFLQFTVVHTIEKSCEGR